MTSLVACLHLGACEEGGSADKASHQSGQEGAAAVSSQGLHAASAERGRRLMAQYQCTACHTVPGVQGTAGHMGPPLTHFGHRSYIAGHIPNDDASLQAWLRSPPALVPGTAMPDLGVTQADARDMAAYLRALR